MVKKATSILLLIVILLLVSCDTGLEIVDMRIETYPNRIIYISGEDTELDLSGGTVVLRLKQNTESIDLMTDRYISVSHDIDFDKPGIYVVTLTRHIASCEFPIQVIDIDDINNIGE